MAEQKLAVLACPRRGNGHLWRFETGGRVPGVPDWYA